MANTSYLKTVVEPYVVRWVGHALGIDLKRGCLIVGLNRHERPVSFEFDGLSSDGLTGVLVSTSRTLKAGGVRKLFMDAAVLLNAPLQRRVLALVDDQVLENFHNQCDGLLPLGRIEFMICKDLPEEMRARMDRIFTEAQTEVGDLGRPRKLGGARK